MGVPKGEYWITAPGFKTSFDTVVVSDPTARACKHRLGVELSVTGACSGSLSSGTGVLLRVDAATPARVVVDGIEDSIGYYDAETRLLELSPGAHHIEIQADGYVPYRIDVTIREFQAVRRVAKLRRLKP